MEEIKCKYQKINVDSKLNKRRTRSVLGDVDLSDNCLCWHYKRNRGVRDALDNDNGPSNIFTIRVRNHSDDHSNSTY